MKRGCCDWWTRPDPMELIGAVRQGDAKKCKILLGRSDTRVNFKDKRKHEALYYAIKLLDIGIIKLLLAHKNIEINAAAMRVGWAVNLAIDDGNVQMVEILISLPGYNINEPARSGFSVARPAYLAHIENRLEILKLLFSYGATGPPFPCLKCSTPIDLIVGNWRTYLDPFKRYGKKNQYYPREFKRIAKCFIMCCLRTKSFPKDIIHLLLEYMAEAWKTMETVVYGNCRKHRLGQGLRSRRRRGRKRQLSKY